MKTFAMFICCAALALSAHGAATFPVTKVMDNGPDAQRLVWVFVGDGYQASEQAKFHADMATALSTFFNTEPWNDYKTYVNVYLIDVPSNQSGSDKPLSNIYVDTYFNTSYDYAGIERLIYVDVGQVYTVAMANVPQYDQAFCIVNDSEYGGAGGSVVTFSTNGLATEVCVHELGHSFAHLADEYSTPYPGYPPGDSEPNVTFQTARANIKWNNWILGSTPVPTPQTTDYSSTVGLFEGARYLSTGIYRPMLDCKMRDLGVPFCPVCKEAHVLSIYGLVEPIESASPNPATPLNAGASGTLTLSVMPQQPVLHSMSIAWQLDGVPIPGETAASLTRTGAQIGAGTHAVKAIVTDPTAWVRTDPSTRLVASRTWTVTGATSTVYGDANGDGLFSLADINQMVDWLLMRTSAPASGTAAFTRSDVNGDGSLGLQDLNLYVDRLLGRIPKFPVEP
jgi:hypothetical protein